MAITFPQSPSTNDIHVVGNISYVWDGDKWAGGGITPIDRLIEDSNILEIENNNLLWTGGNVGIGTPNPTYKLDVNGDSKINGITVGRGTGSLGANTAVGNSALVANTTGNSNTAIGYRTLYSNETGGSNIAIGVEALYSNTAGVFNIANGYRALYSNSTGNNNIANGLLALYSNTTAANNLAIGIEALYSNETGSSNTANGYRALYSNSTGNYNIAIGFGAGDALTTGSNNTIIGDIPGTAGLADTVIIGAGATERLRIDSSGRMGIGVTPESILHVKGTQPSITIEKSAGIISGIVMKTTGSSTDDFIIAAGSGESEFFSNQYEFKNVAGTTDYMIIDSSGNVGIGSTNPQYKLEVNGSFAATTKSFVIDHPTKEGMKLRYGSLEGPENGVYVRGKTTEFVIELPDYWTGLVDADTISVNLTPIGKSQTLWVKSIEDNKVIVGSKCTSVEYFYTIYGERKDVEKLEVEIGA